MEEKPNYYAIIPANVRYNSNLRANEKLLYGEITALASKYGICTASNNYFSKLYEVQPSAISKWIKDLETFGYIEVEYIKQGKEIKQRNIKLTGINKCEYVFTNEEEGYSQKDKENNTSNNNTSKKEIYKERNFKKPTLEEVREYCKERNNNINAESFIDFYESKGWMVGKNKMKDWKACIRTWEKRARTKAVVVETIPGWFDKEQDIKLMTKQEEEEMESLLGGVI